MKSPNRPIIEVNDLAVKLGGRTIFSHVNFSLQTGEVLSVVGASGCGKSVLMRTVLGLFKKKSGHVVIHQTSGVDEPVPAIGTAERKSSSPPVASRIGVMFQHGALYSSLSVGQNIEVPIKEHLSLPADIRRELVLARIKMVGLPLDAYHKFPSELSGGMVKRAALARALILDPAILFLDEPTAGLDPLSAQAFDQLVKQLQKSLNLSIMMVTHDLDSIFELSNRVMVLGRGSVLTVSSLKDVVNFDNPWVQSYFHGPRGRALTRNLDKS